MESSPLQDLSPCPASPRAETESQSESPEKVDPVADEETEGNPEGFRRIGLAPPVAPKLPSLDEMSNDLDVPSEVPAEVPFVVQRHQETPEAPGVVPESASVEVVRSLLERRRGASALRLLPRDAGEEGALLRLKCYIQLRKFVDAVQECETEELKDSHEVGRLNTFTSQAQLFLAQAPWLLRSEALSAVLKLQALAEAWLRQGPEDVELHLKLLQVLSQLSLRPGHGLLGLEALTKALQLERPGDWKRQLWSLQGRHQLSWGNLSGAKDAFDEARRSEGRESTVCLNEGLLAMAQSDYATARGHFEAASASDNPEEALAAENNLAVCKFYTKDLRGACERLEALVQRDAHGFLKPCVLKNLVSLYEFSQDPAQKRQQLQLLAQSAMLEDLDPTLFQAPL